MTPRIFHLQNAPPAADVISVEGGLSVEVCSVGAVVVIINTSHLEAGELSFVARTPYRHSCARPVRHWKVKVPSYVIQLQESKTSAIVMI